MRFPLVYVSCILAHLNMQVGLDSVRTVVQLIENLNVYAQESNSGQEWEIVVNIAILLHCINSQISHVPLHLFGEKLGPINDVTFVKIPPQYISLDEVHSYILETMQRFGENTVAVFSPACANLPKFDAFVVYKKGKEDKMKKIGCQMKIGNRYPTGKVPDWIDRAILIRGNAPEVTTSAEKVWAYMTKSEVQALMGYSMQPLMCMRWDKE